MAKNKLQNIKAVRQMLTGDHKTQTRKSIYTGKSTKDTTKHEVGDRWTDAQGTEWEQREGFRIKNPSRGDRMAEIKNYLMPDNCPTCEEPMTKRLDKKYYSMHKQCMECQVAFETKLRYTGQYDEWERKKVLANVVAWLEDAEKETQMLKDTLSKGQQFVHKDGQVEEWDLPYKVEDMIKNIDEQFNTFKERLLKNHHATEEELQTFLKTENMND